MISTRKLSPRAEYRLRQSEKVKDSVSLAEKFPKLKSLTVHLSYLHRDGSASNGGMKYKPNLSGAKSMLYFNCPNSECVGGDFDLSQPLAQAIGTKRKLATGEMRCAGWRQDALKQKIPCDSVLRYKLTFGY
jgi:hypothetical protein